MYTADIVLPPGSVQLLNPLLDTFSGARQVETPISHLAIMKWLSSVRAVLAGGSRSAPVTPAASPKPPSKADLHAKQVSSKQNRNWMLEKQNVEIVKIDHVVCGLSLQFSFSINLK